MLREHILLTMAPAVRIMPLRTVIIWGLTVIVDLMARASNVWDLPDSQAINMHIEAPGQLRAAITAAHRFALVPIAM